MMLSLCNEVLRDHSLAEQCRIAAALGYGGLEVAPFTLGDDPIKLTDETLKTARGIIEDHGLVVTGLLWLLVAPEGLSITATIRRWLKRRILSCNILFMPVLS